MSRSSSAATCRARWEAIKTLRVRGAPAIGIAAAYGVCAWAAERPMLADGARFFARLDEVADYLADQPADGGQPVLGLERMQRVADGIARRELRRDEIRRGCWPRPGRSTRKIARCAGRSAGTGRDLLSRRPGRADALQRRRAGHGRLRHGAGRDLRRAEAGKRLHVYADETRPLLQGARLTAWELQQRGIDVTLICDSMAAQVMREGACRPS